MASCDHTAGERCFAVVTLLRLQEQPPLSISGLHETLVWRSRRRTSFDEVNGHISCSLLGEWWFAGSEKEVGCSPVINRALRFPEK